MTSPPGTLTFHAGLPSGTSSHLAVAAGDPRRTVEPPPPTALPGPMAWGCSLGCNGSGRQTGSDYG